MKYITNRANEKWKLLYPVYKRATGLRREKIRDRLLELLFWNNMVKKFNKEKDNEI